VDISWWCNHQDWSVALSGLDDCVDAVPGGYTTGYFPSSLRDEKASTICVETNRSTLFAKFLHV
jgi:hypothetical protein